MLIACPSCATSYQIDPASVGPAGRMVRCARCKTTWFAGGPKSAPEVTAFVDSVIAEAEAQAPETFTPVIKPHSMPPAAPNLSTELRAPVPEPEPVARQPEPPPVEHPPLHQTELAPREPIVSEPVAVPDGPPLVPPIEQTTAPAVPLAEPEAEDVETFAQRRQRLKMRRQKKRRSSRWTAIVLVLLAFNVALISARSEVVRFLPQTASLFAAIGLPVNLRNLKFENVRISREAQDGGSILVIEGTIVSTASRPVEVPRLRFAARNATGQEVYTWTALPSRSILEPGEKLAFSSRLASPPADASDVMVRFFNAQDALAGAK